MVTWFYLEGKITSKFYRNNSTSKLCCGTLTTTITNDNGTVSYYGYNNPLNPICIFQFPAAPPQWYI